MAIEINKGIEPFEDQTDFTRGNPDRKQWGKSGVDGLDLRSEYDVTIPTAEPEKKTEPEKKVETPAKLTHKLQNGTVLEAATMEEMATLIEKAVSTQAPPAPLDFEDKPLYVPLEFKPKELSLQQQADILNVWKENPQKALRMLEEAEYGAPMETILSHLTRAEQNELHRRQEVAGVEFLGECETYNPTPGNAKKLTEYLKTKGKPITKQNLVVAFQHLSATDQTLVRKVDAAPVVEEEDKTLIETPPPPVVVPSNLGLPSTPAKAAVDPAKFASLSLNEQKKFFSDLKRQA